MLNVTLSAAPNLDFPMGSYEREIEVAAYRVQVATIEDAGKEVRAFIAEFDLGGGNWTGGDVMDASGKVVARIEYNGRVWEA
jgi:hypothetical protein